MHLQLMLRMPCLWIYVLHHQNYLQKGCLFHDESAFQANDDQPVIWAEKGTRVIQPKSRGSGSMVSNFIYERNGYLQLTQEEYDEAKKNDPTITRYFILKMVFFSNLEEFSNHNKVCMMIAGVWRRQGGLLDCREVDEATEKCCADC